MSHNSGQCGRRQAETASLGPLGIIDLMLSRRALVRVLGLTLACGLTNAIAVRAADANSFARQVALSYHVDEHHVLAADIDRDGDLDVLAATEDGFKIWVNDGTGRFTSRTPEPGALADGHPTANSRNAAELLDHETIQSESIPIVAAYAHAPPDSSSRSTATFDAVVRRRTFLGCRTPRAPPFV